MMTTDTSWPDEPHLSTDFVARVLHCADMVRARRGRVRVALAVAAGALMVALIVVPRIAPTPTGEASGTIGANSDLRSGFLTDFDVGRHFSSGDLTSASDREEDTDVLSYLFPDAAPLARFVDEYSAATYGVETGDEMFRSEGATSRDESL